MITQYMPHLGKAADGRYARWLLLCALLAAPLLLHAGKEHGHTEHQQTVDNGPHESHAGDSEALPVAKSVAAELGIGSAAAGPARLQQTLRLYGRVVPDPQRVSHVRARYAGVIQQVSAQLGERVRAGDVIAKVEANDSLQPYSIRAPIAGVVVQRHANPGEVAADQPLLTIADYRQLWVDLDVFPRDAALVQAGQSLQLSSGSLQHASSVSYLNPGEGHRPTLTAHARLDNGDGRWTPGLPVTAELVVAAIDAAVAVERRALQQLEGREVVFVLEGKHGDSYHFEPRPLQLGRRDQHYAEVLSGLEAGERYVLDNSYLLKAELEKSGAAHQH